MAKAGNTLRKKLYRDMSRAAMQFLSIIVLCMIGTFAFAALDGTARMMSTTVDVYFEENNLADFWVTLPAADRTALNQLASVEGINNLCARATRDLESTLGDDVTVCVTAYDGEMDINLPLVREGALLDPGDRRGCLIEERFAQAHGLGMGERITVKLNGAEYAFVIRGIVVSPEYIVVSNGVAADPTTYGYILINACAMPELPLTQAVVTIADDADANAVEHAIQQLLPDALIVDRGAHNSTARATGDAKMFENMTYIFPVLAYAVAGLIVMTTLSRMIDNQRMQMGTLKALGFSASKIRNHYLSYAIVPSLLGGVLGTVIAHHTLPYMLWDALLGQSEMPYQLEPPISLPAWGMVLLTVIMSMGICFFTYHRAAKETTAALLRPKPPKDGKRILLERITFIWTRLSFNGKMIVRNLLRNKLRTFMSLLGLLCCTMLIITSLGLQDSVMSLTENYYYGTMRYDLYASLKGSVGTAESYEQRIDAEVVECVMDTSVSLRAAAGSRTTRMSILADNQTMQRLGEDHALIALEPGKLAVTYKLSQTLDIAVGDEVMLYLPGDDEPVRIAVGQIVENNVSQGVYMNRSTWESLRKGEFRPTAIQIKGPGERCMAQLDSLDEIDQIHDPHTQVTEMLKMLDTLSAVFAILTFIALALAFVICYNMGLMNFVERVREYATLKVLGYHQKEIRSLILRENMIISVLGVLSGVGPGYLLTDVVMHACEPETGFYPGVPSLQSIVIACLVTFFFSIFIQLLLTRKVRTIDMVEALKSVE